MRRWVRAFAAVSALCLFAPAPARAGMTQVLQASGPYVPSIDGAGDANTSSMSYTLTRPSAASTVFKVYATVTSISGGGDPGQNCLTVGGIPLALTQVQTEPAATVYTRFDDVTASLSGYLNALPVGASVVPVVEAGPSGDNDGNGLIVVWEDPAFPMATMAVMFGSELTGSGPLLQLATDPINTAAAGFHVDVGIGISFSTGVAPMVSDARIEGVLVSSNAGGYDDGNQLANGALYTLGGDGDTPNRERYDATPLIANGSVMLDVRLGGASFDDYATAIWLWGVGVTVDGPCDPGDPDADGDLVPDPCDLCPGFDDTIDVDADLVPDGCDPCPNGPNDVDTDGDGIADGCDLCPGGNDNVDADGDGFANACDAEVYFLSPKRGPIGGGGKPLVIGANFDDTCVVSFDGIDAPTWYVDEFTLEAETEAHDAGLVDVAVLCVSGADTLVGGYTFYDDGTETGVPPELLSVLPNQVSVAGGDEVTLTGTGFAPDVAVTVDGVPAEANRIDAETLSVVVPLHEPGLAAVEVVNGDGLADTLEGALLYVPPGVLPEAGDTDAPSDDTAPVDPAVGGCATAPSFAIAPLLLAALALRRRRVVPLALLAAACSDYEVVGSEEVPVAPGDSSVSPIALTGPAATSPRFEPVSLDGSASYDPDHPEATVAWSWELTDFPAGATPVLTDATTAHPSVEADTLGVYVVSLQVTDEDLLLSENPAAQVVEIVPWRDLEVTLEWDASVDLDLHLIAPGGTYYGAEDCFFGNSTPSWGEGANGEDDPLLAEDDDGAVAGAHTERITLTAPAEGVHQLVAVYWNDRGTPMPAAATVTVTGGGAVLAEATMTLDAAGEAVVVGALDWTSLGWAADGSATTHDDLGGPPFNE